MKTTYSAKGLVYGNFWGGGRGSYPSEKVKAETLEELNNKINEGIEIGSLDSGFGFNGLIGAIMCIKIHREIEVDGLIFKNEEEVENYEFYGELSEEDRQFLSSAF